MKKERGEYGYLKQKKQHSLFHTLFMVAIGIVIFIVGLLLNKMEASNIFTVAAVLFVLPAAKSLVAIIVLAPYQETKKEDWERLAAYAKEGDTLLSDAVFTSSERIMHLNQIYVTDHQIIGISLRKRDNIKAASEYLEKELSIRELSYVVFLTQEENALKKRMSLRRQESSGTGQGDSREKQEVLEMLRTFII